MPLPQPEGWEDRFLALERKVNDLFSSIQNRTPMTTASAGWKLPAMTTPSATPASGGHLFANGTEPYWKDSGGSIYSLKTPPFPVGSSVDNPAGLSASTAPADYNVLHSQALHDDDVMLRNKVIELLGSLRTAGLIL